MTRLPSSLLRESITIRDYLGDGADGSVFGPPRTARARFEGRRRAVRTAGGTDVISSGSVAVRPGQEAPVESRVECRGRTYEVAEVITLEGLTRPAGYELVLT